MKNILRRTRKHRRLEKARLKTGKPIVTHKLIGGRTGSIAGKRRKGLYKEPMKTADMKKSTEVVESLIHTSKKRVISNWPEAICEKAEPLPFGMGGGDL